MRLYEFNVNVENYEGYIESNHVNFQYIGKFFGNFNWDKAKKPELTTFVKPTLEKIKNSSLYRYPKLILPRDKVSTIKQSLDITITRNIEKADYRVVSSKYMAGLTQTHTAAFTGGFFKENSELFSNCFTKNARDKIEAETNKIFSQYGENVYFIFRHKSTWNNKSQFLWYLHGLVTKYRDNLYSVYIPVNNLKAYEELLEKNNVISDVYLNQLCDSQSNVLDDNDIKTIISLLETEDVENHEVALNLIANCNIDESYDKVAYIFYFYNGRLRTCPSWNSVNVKQMRRVMKVFNNFNDFYSGIYYTRYIYYLSREGKITKWSKQMSAKMLIERGFKHFGISNTAFKINPDDIEVCEPDDLYVL